MNGLIVNGQSVKSLADEINYINNKGKKPATVTTKEMIKETLIKCLAKQETVTDICFKLQLQPQMVKKHIKTMGLIGKAGYMAHIKRGEK